MLQDFCQYHIFTRYQMNEMVSRNIKDINSKLLQNHVKFFVINFQWPANVSSSQDVIVLVLYRIGCSLCVRYWPRAQTSNCKTCQVDHGLMQLDLLYLLHPIVEKAFINLKSFPTPMLGSIHQSTIQELKLQKFAMLLLSSLDFQRLNVLRMT